MNVPRVEPYLPLLLSSNEIGTAPRCTLLSYTPTSDTHAPGATTRTFVELVLESVCLQCASPLTTNCGFNNCALTHDENANWNLELAHCECEQCEQYCADAGADGDPRKLLLERHNWQRLDAALGVDKPLAEQLHRVPHLIPVLHLRRLLFPLLLLSPTCGDAALIEHVRALDRAVPLEHIFCSFAATVQFVVSTDGQRIVRTVLLERTEELERLFQLAVPGDVRTRPAEHRYLLAALLRVATAYRLIEPLQRDLRLRYVSDSRVQQLVLLAQLYADTHLDLHLYCDAFGGNYCDAFLETPMLTTMFGSRRTAHETLSECVHQTPLERCYPHALRAVYVGEMPDLTCSLSQANVWSNVRNANDSRVSSLLHILLVKVTPKKCMIRELSPMLSRELGRQSTLLPVLLNLLECSLLGAYPGARRRTLWRARLCVRRSLHWDTFALHTWCAGCHPKSRAACPKCPGGAAPTSTRDSAHSDHLCSMCEYLRANKYWVFFALKEFYVYTVRRNALLNTMLEQDSGWIEHWTMLLRSLDDARGIISDAFTNAAGVDVATVRAALQRASRHMALLHDCNKPTMMHEPHTPFFWLTLLDRVARHHTLQIVRPFWSGPQEPQDFLVAPLPLPEPADGAYRLPLGDARAPHFGECDVPLVHCGGRRWCEVYTLERVDRLAVFMARRFGDLMPALLGTVGMSPAAIESLQLMLYNSRVRVMPENQLGALCRAMRVTCPTDFHLLHYFLRCMERECSVDWWSLDAAQEREQEAALRLRHRLAPWEELPAAATRVYFCRNDSDLFAPVVKPSDAVSEREKALAGDGTALPLADKVVGARGVTDAYYCYEHAAPMCSRDIDSTLRRELRKHGHLVPYWVELSASDSKEQRKRKTNRANSVRDALQSARACMREPLEAFSLLGRVVRVGSRAYTFCVRCGSVCLWQQSSASSQGATCGREIRYAPRARFTELRQFVTPALQQVREWTASHSHVGGMLGEIRETLLCAPRRTDTLADVFTRQSSPVFDQRRSYERIALVASALGVHLAPLRLENGASMLIGGAETVPALVPSASSNDVDDDDAEETQVLPQQPQPSATLAAELEQHRQRLEDYSEDEWTALADDEKMFAWLPEGHEHRKALLAVRARQAPDAEELCAALEQRWQRRVEDLRYSKHYERELDRLRQCEIVRLQAVRARLPLVADQFSASQLDDMRRFMVGIGAMPVRHEVLCAFHETVCDPRGAYRALWVVNSDRVLQNARTREAVEQRGLVRIFLCANCFRHVFNRLLRRQPVPLASDVFLCIKAQRERALTARKNGGGGGGGGGAFTC